MMKMKSPCRKIKAYPLLLTTTEIHALFADLWRTLRNETIENLKVESELRLDHHRAVIPNPAKARPVQSHASTSPR